LRLHWQAVSRDIAFIIAGATRAFDLSVMPELVAYADIAGFAQAASGVF